MDLTRYLDRKVKIILNNGFTFIGLAINCDENSISIIDKNSSEVCLKENTIARIMEVLS